MTPPVTFTHKGWFGLCPVYIGDINTEGPCLDPRHRKTGPADFQQEGR